MLSSDARLACGPDSILPPDALPAVVSCQVSHVGYAVAGRIVVRLDDGTERTISAGQSYTIPPGHDAWVEGNEPFVGIEVMSAEQYAKSEP